jgi:putative transposase
MLNRRMKTQEEHSYLIDIIYQIRRDHPTMSCRAMYFKINPKTLGRDKFESLCGEWGFISTRPINYHRTTNSNGVIRFENLLVNVNLTGMNQAFVSDITYYEVQGKFFYLTFILDAYTRCIIGHSVSDRLTTEKTTLPALKMAIKRRKNIPAGIIFHSDGGGQYYDKAFLALTSLYKFKNSMCEHAYENGKAERINGIIKNNYLKYMVINNLYELTKSVDRVVELYNNSRPHKALKYQTPQLIEMEQLNLFSKQSRG